MQKKKIGIYGGTFNPIHNGHIHVLRTFAQRLALSRVLIIPACLPPHKTQEWLAPPQDRLAMCRLAVGTGQDVLEVSDLEIRHGGKSYTAETLTELHKRHPEAALVLLMGEDMFLTLRHWRSPEVIFEKAEICVAPRSAEGLDRLEELRAALAEQYHAKINFENIAFMDVSSTEIRRRVRAGESIQDLVPQQVAEYIRQEKLYLPEN